ncbi:MAG: HPr kinase/phosphorylase [Rhodothalassiaceae bacterium]
MSLFHATAVALAGRAVLLTGPSGAGKSDLALRLIDRGAVLVADDYVELRRDGASVRVQAPAAIAGRLEVRGLGLICVPYRASAPLAMIADLLPRQRIERLPQPASRDILATPVPVYRFDAFDVSAAMKVELALAQIG